MIPLGVPPTPLINLGARTYAALSNNKSGKRFVKFYCQCRFLKPFLFQGVVGAIYCSGFFESWNLFGPKFSTISTNSDQGCPVEANNGSKGVPQRIRTTGRKQNCATAGISNWLPKGSQYLKLWRSLV